MSATDEYLSSSATYASVSDEYLAHNAAYASTFEGPLPLPPLGSHHSSPTWKRKLTRAV